VSLGTRLEKLLEDVRSSLWFVPSLMTIASFVLSLVALRLDLDHQFPDDAWYIFSGGPAGAGSVLSTIAGSMIGVTGVTFSITVVALSLASQQFGPRLLRNFMSDRSVQIVLGTFIATFVFCLLGLQAIDRTAELNQVPRLSVSIGFGLALASLAVLIYFIHHITRSIQAETVLANVSNEMHQAMDKLYPATLGEAGPEDEREVAIPPFEAEGFTVRSRHSGYLQAIDEDEVMELAVKHDLVLEIAKHPGEFVAHGAPVLRAWPGSRVDERLGKRLEGIFVVGSRKTPQQDLAFVFEQLVEVAVRALSPGVNDPYTAVSAIDRLGDGLAHLACRRLPSPHREDETGSLRLVVSRMTFEAVVDLSLNPLRRHGATDVAVAHRLLVRLGDLAGSMRTGDRRVRHLADHAARVHLEAAAEVQARADRDLLDSAHRRVVAIAAERMAERAER